MELVIFLLGLGLGGILGYALALQKCMENRKKEIIEDILEDLKDIQDKCDDVTVYCNDFLDKLDALNKSGESNE